MFNVSSSMLRPPSVLARLCRALKSTLCSSSDIGEGKHGRAGSGDLGGGVGAGLDGRMRAGGIMRAEREVVELPMLPGRRRVSVMVKILLTANLIVQKQNERKSKDANSGCITYQSLTGSHCRRGSLKMGRSGGRGRVKSKK